MIRPEGPALYRGEGEGRFADVTAAAAFPAREGLPATGAFADVDHDGDLDVVIPGLLLRNNGDGTFADVTGEAGFAAEGAAVAVVPTDFDNGRDLDVLVLRREKGPVLFRNLRDGRFEDVAEAVGLEVAGPFSSVGAGDLNKDFYPDFVLGTAGSTATLALSDGRGRFRVSPAPAGSGGAAAVQALDYDNDGLLDLLVATGKGARLFRSLGGGWSDVTAAALPEALREADLSGAALAVADLDADGDPDVLVGTAAGTTLYANEGGNAHNSFAVDLEGRVSSKGAVGAKVALRAGSLKQKIETSAAVPMAAPGDVVFGLGPRPGPDTVRVIWVSGIVQTETEFPGGHHRGHPDRHPAAGAGPQALLLPVPLRLGRGAVRLRHRLPRGGGDGLLGRPGGAEPSRPLEYVRLAPASSEAQDGRYELRVTNELEEVMYLDEVRLLAVEHPVGVEVYPDEGMTGTPKEFRLFGVRDLRVPRVTGRVRRRRHRERASRRPEVRRGLPPAPYPWVRRRARPHPGPVGDPRDSPGPAAHRLDGLRVLQRQRGRFPGGARPEASPARGGDRPGPVGGGGSRRGHPGGAAPDGRCRPGRPRHRTHRARAPGDQHADLLGPHRGGGGGPRPAARARGARPRGGAALREGLLLRGLRGRQGSALVRVPPGELDLPLEGHARPIHPRGRCPGPAGEHRRPLRGLEARRRGRLVFRGPAPGGPRVGADLPGPGRRLQQGDGHQLLEPRRRPAPPVPRDGELPLPRVGPAAGAGTPGLPAGGVQHPGRGPAPGSPRAGGAPWGRSAGWTETGWTPGRPRV